MRLVALTASGLVTSLVACTLFTDFEGLSDPAARESAPDAADQTDARANPPPNSCATDSTCTSTPPTGWNFVAVRFGPGGDCPAGFSDGIDLIELDGTPAQMTCDCACDPPTTSGSCTTGNFIEVKTGMSCTQSFGSVSPSGTCKSIFMGASGAARAAPVAVEQAPCGGTVQPTPPPAVATKPARFCGLEAAPTSCGSGQCVPKPSGTYALCVVGTSGKRGACPSGYSRRHELGTSVNDTRTCASCACETTDTCENPRIELFDDYNCDNPPGEAVAADATCRTFSAATRYAALRYAVDRVAGATCKPVSSTTTGAVALTGAVPLCCPSDR